jgi:archaellum biogenesis ATPase FlaH
MNLLNIALEYHAAELRVVPIREDKRPAVASWKQYQTVQTENDVREMFTQDQYGIAILTGIDGLECVDVDSKYDLTGTLIEDLQTANDWINDKDGQFQRLTIQRTRSGGWHILYKCPHPEGNKKLAERPASGDEDPNTTPVLLETRGIGGYIVAAPTPGYSLYFGSFKAIPAIKQSTRDTLIRVCRSFDQSVKPDPQTAYREKPKEEINTQRDGLTPWQDYNERTDAVDVLQAHGWTVVYEDGERIYMKRPGNTDAKTSGNYHKTKGVFVSHTTSTPLPTGVGLNAFSVYAHLKHGGDFKAAARALSSEGYGAAPQARQEVQAIQQRTPEQVQAQDDALIAFVKSTRFDLSAPITEEAATLTVSPPDSGQVYKVGGRSMIGAIVGEQKSGKSFVCQNIVASALMGGYQSAHFSQKMEKDDRILYFDTEQSEYFYKRSQARIYEIAGISENDPRYEAYHLRRLPVDQRLKAVEYFIRNGKAPSFIIIDGIVDLCRNFNDERESADLMNLLLQWTDETQALLITVLHLTKGNGFMRGHLGTALQNKCDFSIEIALDKDWPGAFSVKSRDSRFPPFPKFSFIRDPKTGLTTSQSSSQFPSTATPELLPWHAVANERQPEGEDLPF